MSLKADDIANNILSNVEALRMDQSSYGKLVSTS